MLHVWSVISSHSLSLSAAALFRVASLTLVALFLWFGMDVRRKAGTGSFVGHGWQTLMKLAAFSLIGLFVRVVLTIPEPRSLEWIALGLMGSGTACVVAAKRTLGSTHTFAGQYRHRTQLVTRGVYALTRNPLYFGVYQCELGASICAARRAPDLFPGTYLYWLAVTGAALAYVVAFNWSMARREAQQLERQFGDGYRQYAAHVPFLIPFTTQH